MNKIKNAIDTLIKIFDEENLPIVSRAVFKRDEIIPSDKWSFTNRCLMYLHETNDARGYKQWNKVERNVTKGSKAIYIIGPRLKKVTETKNGVEIEKKILTGFYGIPVFRYEDTEGEELEYIKNFNFTIPCQFNKIIDNLGLTIIPVEFVGLRYGSYDIETKEIQLATPEIKTFLHELCHAVDGKFNKLVGGQDPTQEVVAEFSAAVIGHMLGYKVPYGNVKSYVINYDLKKLVKSLNRVEQVVKYVIENTEVKK